MTPTYDNEARSQEAHRRTQDSLDAVGENTELVPEIWTEG
jgi:hypothetical protein